MKWLPIATALTLIIMLTALSSARGSTIVRRNTPEAANAIEQLKVAQRAYSGNATSFTDTNPGLDHYYARKARETGELITRLRNGEPVATVDIDRALQSQGARAFGSGF